MVLSCIVWDWNGARGFQRGLEQEGGTVEAGCGGRFRETFGWIARRGGHAEGTFVVVAVVVVRYTVVGIAMGFR